jgi:hypothetical protein
VLVGVPVILPDWSRLIPGGRVPEVKAYVYGGIPNDDCSVKLYGCMYEAAGSCLIIEPASAVIAKKENARRHMISLMPRGTKRRLLMDLNTSYRISCPRMALSGQYRMVGLDSDRLL